MIKINTLELENIKRIKAVTLTPAENGLTVIGGKNGQGKTSVLDAIAWALGGDRYKPSHPDREGSVIPPHLKVTLSNGLIVERSGESSRLKVIDPAGNKGGQQLLNGFIEQLALDLPKFMQSSNKDKANTLLQIIGVGDKLYALDSEEQQLYNQRHAIGQIADQKTKFAQELPFFAGLPDVPVSAAELIQQQQEILARNGANEKKRKQLLEFQAKEQMLANEIAQVDEIIKIQLERKARLEAERTEVIADKAIAEKTVEQLRDESTDELEKSLADVEALNVKIRANLDRAKALAESEHYKEQYEDLTEKINEIRKARLDLLNNADMPLEGLSVDEGELVYNGFKWDNMSGSEQLKAATAIVRRLNPKCGFVLLDKLEQMDKDTLKDFAKWLEAEGLQVIATRVSTDDECSVIIEDGYSLTPERTHSINSIAAPKWTPGSF